MINRKPKTPKLAFDLLVGGQESGDVWVLSVSRCSCSSPKIWWCVVPFSLKKICACCALLMRLSWCFSIWCMFPLSMGVRAAPPISLNRLCWRGIPLGACCFLFQICSLFLKNLNGPWWSPSFSQSGSLHYSHAWRMPLS